MQRITSHRPSGAMVVAIIALIVSSTGTAVAAKLITGKQIAKNAVTSPKVKNGSLLRADFKAGQVPAGARGAQGPQGPQGLPGVAGQQGATGPAGAPNPNAEDSDKLDGLDSSAFASRTLHNNSFSDLCGAVNPTFGECANVDVIVPAGKSYHVSVWSSASWLGTGTTQFRDICSARRKLAPAPAETAPSCISPFGEFDRITSDANVARSASISGETTVGPGTWRFSTAVRHQTTTSTISNENNAITKILVRDAAGPVPAKAVSAVRTSRR